MDKSVEVDARGVRRDPGRPRQPGMFAKITADYYGTPTPLQQLASFTAPEARIILIQPYDMGAMAQHREGDPRLRPRREPVQRRQGAPLRLPRAHRGAPQGVHQGRQDQGRGRPGRGAQRAPHRQAGPREAREGRRGRQGRRHRCREAPRRAHQEAHRRRSTRCSSTRKPSCSRSEPPRR